MSDMGGSFWTAFLGSNAVTAVLSYGVPSFLNRKKDASAVANELIDRLSKRLQVVEEGHEHCQAETADLRAICERNDLIMCLMIPELHDARPDSVALRQARRLLGERYPVDLATPKDMLDTLKRID